LNVDWTLILADESSILGLFYFSLFVVVVFFQVVFLWVGLRQHDASLLFSQRKTPVPVGSILSASTKDRDP